MENKQREKVEIHDIEKLNRLTDDVLKIYERKICLYNANYYDIAEIVNLLEPIRRDILGAYRDDGTDLICWCDSELFAGETLDDDYLMSFFATKLRDEKRISEVQNFSKCYYLLVRGYPTLTDGDEYIGIYTDLRKLRKVYTKEQMNLENNIENYGHALVLKIYRFDENEYGKNEYQGELVKPEELWGAFLIKEKQREFKFDPSIQRFIENILNRRGIDYDIVEIDGCKKIRAELTGKQFHKVVIRARCEQSDFKMCNTDIRIMPTLHESEFYDKLVLKEVCADVDPGILRYLYTRQDLYI